MLILEIGSVMSVDIREEGEELSFIAASSDGTVKAWSGSSLKRVPHTYTATQSAMD